MTNANAKKVLVLGGTGAMGSYLVPLLVDCGYQVEVTSRKARQSDTPNITYLQGSAKDIEFIKGLADGCNYAAIFDFMLYSYPEFKERYEQLLAMTSQYFFVSSYRVYADADVAITEDTPRKVDLAETVPRYADDHYGMSKGRQENLLFSSGQKNWVIIRPSMTFSTDRFQFGCADNFDVIRSQRELISALPSSVVHQKTSLTYGKDVAKMLVRLIGNEQSYGQAFNMSTGENHQWCEVADIYGEVFGLDWIEVDTEAYDAAYGQHAALIDRELNRAFDASKMLAATGLTDCDFYTLEQGLSEAWAGSKKSNFKNSNRAIEAHVRVDKLTNSIVDYSLLPEGIRKAYHEESLKVRGASYSCKNAPESSDAPTAHADSKQPGTAVPVSGSERLDMRVKRARKLVAKGASSIKRDGVMSTAKRVAKWAKKKLGKQTKK